MDYKNKLNTNIYHILKDNRKAIYFLGLFTLSFWLFYPLAQEARYKNNYIRTLSKAIMVKNDMANYTDFFNKSKINKVDLAKATAYMDCRNGKTYF